MKVISVNITKGGCAKTTTVQALAEIFNKKYGKKVLCIDTDPQCNLTSVSNINIIDTENHNLYTLLKGTSTLENTIRQCKYYDIIPSSILLAYADVEFNRLGREYMIKEIIDKVEGYDVVLIDTPPSLGLLNIMSLTASHQILIPTEPSPLALIGLAQLNNTIESVKKHSNTDLEILGILLVKFKARTNVNSAILKGLKTLAAEINTKVFDIKIRETVKIKEAQSLSKPLLDWDYNSSAVQDYLAFADELMLL